jgi:hypothetical protein
VVTLWRASACSTAAYCLCVPTPALEARMEPSCVQHWQRYVPEGLHGVHAMCVLQDRDCSVCV